MASLSIKGGLWFPARLDESVTTVNNATYIIDASGEKAALIVRVPKTGNLQSFGALIGAVANAPDNGLRFSFQDVDATTGLPDGTADQSATVASGSVTTGWLDPGNFDTTRAVTAGDLIAMVIDIPSFTAGDSVAVSTYTMSTDGNQPYGVSATSTLQTNLLPVMALRYDDGSYEPIAPEIFGVTAITSLDMHTGTSPDEAGMLFQVPWPCTLRGIAWFGRIQTTGNTADVVVYDASNSVLTSITLDADQIPTVSSIRTWHVPLPSPVVLAKNTNYRVVIKPNSATLTARLYYATFASSALMDSVDGGSSLCFTSRADGGTWTNYNNGTDGFRLPRIHLYVNGFDDGVRTYARSRVVNG